ncbi:TniQ family protein [Parasulfitobacter algicola]|uniref:TniQ family protein n=1 Tax=Parasulfitobacter algicola TaxID=2614809 RepID=A0ABX2ISU7_9RHOB|nr:TniQ family protein [Sulfitobacter algicola]NSX53278.1 TniQ family protein [Sulfitobacter algicola]
MKPLALRPEPIHRETLHSFVSRMAAMNRVDTVDFCVDMGFSMKKLIDPNEEVLNIIAAIGGLDVKSVSTLRAWTAEKSDDVRMIFRGEEFVSRALKNPRVRGCPICLQEDAETDPERPLAAMAMRGEWQLREMSVCVRHKHPLVTLWERKKPVERFNIGARLFDVLKDLQDGKFDLTQTQPTAYDLWLDQRLENGHDPTCLVDNSLYAATTFCRLLGTEMLRLRNEKHPNDFTYMRAAQRTGFDIASKGNDAVSDAYKELAADASSAGDLPNKAFGDLYRSLARAHRNDRAFDGFRHVLWDRIILVWPVAANEEILGFTLPERKLHCLLSAAQEAGVGEKFLDQLLVEAGAYPADDTRPASRKTFDAVRYAKLIAEIPKLVGPIAMREAMGATQAV